MLFIRRICVLLYIAACDMKSYLTLIIFCTALICLGQKKGSVLPHPERSFFNKGLADNGDIIHNYLSEYFHQTQDKKFIKNKYNWDCNWTEVYNSNIIYERYICHEAGFDVTVTFPNITKEELSRICKILFKFTDHKWYNDYQYGPLDDKAGCRIRIEKEESTTVLTYICGC